MLKVSRIVVISPVLRLVISILILKTVMRQAVRMKMMNAIVAQ